MNLYFVKTPKLIQNIFKDYTWSFTSSKKEIYLTFDDGPIPQITPWVLKTLAQFNAKATFFCVGDNIQKYPDIFKKIVEQGHSFGNHTFNHLSGWKTKTEVYVNNVEKAEKVTKMEDGRQEMEGKRLTNINNQQPITNNQNLKLFRPPYGKITSAQAKALQKKGFQIIMWDVLSADFNPKISKEKCLDNIIKNTQNGSIIVFHDSEKAFKNLVYTLPEVLDYFTKKGFIFKAL